MGHDISAHFLEEDSKTGYDAEPHAHFHCHAFYRGASKLYELLGASKFDGGPSGTGDGCKVSKRRVSAALNHYCERRLAGEDVLAELAFVATILAEWWPGARSVYIHFG